MNIFPTLVGNNRIKQTLSGSLSHAYIIEGAEGSGRLTAARNAAAAALCLNRDDPDSPLPCGHCNVCSQIFRGIHQDVTELSCGQNKSIGVDTVRELKTQVFISPAESDYRFFIIRDADLMTAQAQNALLLSLEEPPAYSKFFLLVTDKSLLLETIRSRCVILSTDKLSDDVIAEELQKLPEGERMHSRDPEGFHAVVKAANGALGKGIGMITGEEKASDELQLKAAELVRVILTGTQTEKVILSAAFPKSRDEADRIFTLALNAVRDIVSHKMKTGADMLFYRDPGECAAFSSAAMPRLMGLADTLEDARTALSGNASVLLVAQRVIMHK